jgi:hypothetical protein
MPSDEWAGPEIPVDGELEFDPPTTIENFLEEMGEINEKALYPTDMKDAIVGMVERFGMEPQILLDREKCIEILASQGMTHEEALEFFEFNTIGAFMGEEGTPCFATFIKKD